MKFRLLLIKRKVEDVLMFPFILIGRILARLKPLNKEYSNFFFFPFYHTGGAEKIHALITKATGNNDCIIFFTRKSHNKAFLQKFRDAGCVIHDVSKYTDNKFIYFVNLIFRGLISGYINRQLKAPVVFNGQCNFGYKLSPWVKKSIRQIELIHSISNFSYIRIPFLPFISKTVMISQQKIDEHLRLYKRFAIPEKFAMKIQYIPNASEFDNIAIGDKEFSTLQVMYSGRATAEKRAYLVVKIAEAVNREDASIKFVMAGDTFENLDKATLPFIRFAGNISDENALAELYRQSGVVCITSATEGFPLAVIEGMAYGNVIIATPVGDLPVHVKEGANGFLFSSADDEKTIIAEGTAFILRLKNDRNLLQTMAANNILYAQQNFSYSRFARDYQKLMNT